VSWLSASVADVPKGVTTLTETTPESDGAVARIVVGETTVNLDEAFVPKSTVLTDSNPLPVTVTVAPPPADTALGDSAVTAEAPAEDPATGGVTATVGVKASTGFRRVCPLGVVSEVAEKLVRASEPAARVLDAGIFVKSMLLISGLGDADVVPADALRGLETFNVMSAVKTQRHTKSTACGLGRKRRLKLGAAAISALNFCDERPNGDTSWPISSLIPRGARLTEMGLGHSHFGGPADSVSPVALRHSLAEDLPFRLIVRFKYGGIPTVCQPKLPG
jgi:hypothetical protein